MKKLIAISVLGLLLWGQPFALWAEYRLVVLFTEGPNEGRVYKMSDEGYVTFLYTLAVTNGGEPWEIRFAPNGKWGIVGNPTWTLPSSQITTLLKVDKNQDVSVLGFLHNDKGFRIAISPDSQYGVYGWDLKTVRINSNLSYQDIPTTNTDCDNYHYNFSKFNGRLYAEHDYYKIYEYKMQPDGRMVHTGFIFDMLPAYGYQDLRVSPDGRILIHLNGDPDLLVMEVHEQGGLTLIQEVETYSLNPDEVEFTPDGKYAIVLFCETSGRPDLRSFRIEDDLHLTEVSVINLPGGVGDTFAMTPDGKYVITRELVGAGSQFYIVRVHEDGTLEHLPDRSFYADGFSMGAAFVPPQITEVDSSWNRYE